VDLSKVKVAIALPHTAEWFSAEFVDSFFCIERPFKMTYIRPKGHHVIDLIRNMLCEKAIESECTHVFMADTDQTYKQSDIILKMLEHDVPIVGAKIHLRFPPFDPVLKRYGENGFPEYVKVSEPEWRSGELIPVDATGTGCLLIKTEVFKQLKKPWFKMCLDTEPAVGEDVYFCHKARQAGIPIYVDCSIKVGHLKTMSIDEEKYFAYKSALTTKLNQGCLER
jgi:GT2 family glycosyltransferase